MTLGRHATLADGAMLFRSVLYPSVPRSSRMNSGFTPPEAPGFRKLHLLYSPPSPSPEMPHTLASVAADMTSFAAENGVCTSHAGRR